MRIIFKPLSRTYKATIQSMSEKSEDESSFRQSILVSGTN